MGWTQEPVKRLFSRLNGAKKAETWAYAAWMALLNAVLAMFFLARYTLVMPGLGDSRALVFALLSVAGHGFFLSLLFSVPSAALVLAGRGRGAVTASAVFSYSVLHVLLAVDSSVYRLYRFHLNGMVWELITGGALGSIIPLEGPLLMAVIALPPAVLLLSWGAARAAWRLKNSRGMLKPALAAGLVCLAAANAMYAWADAAEVSEVARLARYLPAYKPLTAKRMFRKLGWAGERSAVAFKFGGNGSSLAYPLEEINGGTGGKNILLIFIDGWRKDDFNERVTPNIAALAKRGEVFGEHYSSGNATRFGVFGFFYGIHATYWHDVLNEKRPPVLIEAARKAGYRFGVFASAPLTSPEFDRTVFASVRDKIDLSLPGENAVARDLEINRRFAKFVGDGGDRPFFSFLFYDAPHFYAFPEGSPTPFTPYAEGVNHLALSSSSDPAPIHNRLKNSYHFTDSLVGRALADLEKAGKLENTVIIITSDHGEEVNDTGQNYWGHNSAFDRAQSMVPFIMVAPGRGPGAHEGMTSHVDVAPTLLKEVFGVETPAEAYSNGRSLYDVSPRPYVVVGNWDSFAVVGRERVDVSEATGDLNSYDSSYRPLSTPPDRTRLLAVLKEISRFYAGRVSGI